MNARKRRPPGWIFLGAILGLSLGPWLLPNHCAIGIALGGLIGGLIGAAIERLIPVASQTRPVEPPVPLPNDPHISS